MRGYAPGQFQADYETRIDFDQLRAYRWRRVQDETRQRGIDGVFVWRDENVRYLAALRAIMIQYRASTTYGVLLPRDGKPVLFLSSAELARARESMPWIEEFHPIPIMDEPGLVERAVHDKIAPAFHQYGLERGRVAIDSMSYLQMWAYRKFLPDVVWEDGESLMMRARMIKGTEELKVIEEATAIADAVTQTAIESIAAGKRECEVAADAMRTGFVLGSEFGHLAGPFVASGERMSPPTRFATDKIIRHGDVVFIDIGACWNGYFSDVGRTVICGKPSTQQKRIYTAVFESLQAGIASIRPGVKCSDVAAAFEAEAAHRGLHDHFINLFIGHGIGICPTEPPFVGETMPGASDPVLEPGMVLALEPLIWLPGVKGGGGVRIEDMVQVTEAGAHVMSRAPYDERLML